MTRENNIIDRGIIADAIRNALQRLPGIERAAVTTTGVVAYTADDDQIKIALTMDCRTMPHVVEIIDDAMVVIDREGNGCDMHVLTNRRAAQRQLQKWQAEYTFDYDEALIEVTEFFAAQ